MTTQLHQQDNFYSVRIFRKSLNKFTLKYTGKAKDKISIASMSVQITKYKTHKLKSQ